MSSSIISPSSAAAAYAEPFVDGRRVVIFGDSDSALAQLLLERGARSVHVYDQDNARAARVRAANGSRSISFGTLDQASSHERSFDFGIVENLAQAASGEETLQSLLRSLAVRGAALVGSPNAEAPLGLGLLPKLVGQGNSAPNYYELYDLVAEHFSEVRMLGQLPFVGYAIADFSAEREADINVDTGLVPGGAEEPEWFWALCSQEPVLGEAFSIIQLPLAQVLAARSAAGNTTSNSTASPASRGSKEKAPNTGAKDARDDAPFTVEIGELRAKLEERERSLAESKSQVSAASERAARLEAELEQLRAAARAVQDAATQEATAGAARWSAEREELLARLHQAEEGLQAQTQQDSAVSQESKAAAAHDITSLEATLRERAEHVTQLEARLLEAERVVGDLVRELDMLRQRAGQSPSPVTDQSELNELKTKLDNLALANAERATLLASAESTIQELEGKLLHLTADTTGATKTPDSVAGEVQPQLGVAAQQPASS